MESVDPGSMQFVPIFEQPSEAFRDLMSHISVQQYATVKCSGGGGGRLVFSIHPAPGKCHTV